MVSKMSLLAFICLVVLTGCTSASLVADQATKYNLALEENSNEVLLLNVIRASQRRPLYFTALSKFSGMVGKTGSGLSFALGPGSSSIYTLTPSIDISPSFDVSPMDNEEFKRGFLQPVSMGDFDFYWKQGWPKELLLTLFIERLEGEGVTYDNYPPNAKGFSEFQGQVRNSLYGDGDCRTKPNQICPGKLKNKVFKTAIGQPVDLTASIADLKDIFSLASMPNLSIEIDEKSSKLQLYKIEPYFTICKSNTEGECDSDKPNAGGSEISRARLRIQTAESKGFDVIFRSPEGVVYFLGEIVRGELENDAKPSQSPYEPPSVTSDYCRNPARIFYVREATAEDANPYVSVTYDGKRYVIPKLKDDLDKCPSQRTMQVLTLLAQLVQMQKSGKNLSTTPTVRLQ